MTTAVLVAATRAEMTSMARDEDTLLIQLLNTQLIQVTAQLDAERAISAALRRDLDDHTGGMPMKFDDRTTPEMQEFQSRLEESARTFAYGLDRALNPEMTSPMDAEHRVYGFALLLFSFGDPPQPSTYISNANREDMIRVIEEWLQRAKARQ